MKGAEVRLKPEFPDRTLPGHSYCGVLSWPDHATCTTCTTNQNQYSTYMQEIHISHYKGNYVIYLQSNAVHATLNTAHKNC